MRLGPSAWVDGKRACRIAGYREGSILDPESALAEIRAWHVDKLLRLKEGARLETGGVRRVDRESLLSLAEAREHAKAILRDVKLGIDPAAEKRAAADATTFADLPRPSPPLPLPGSASR